MKTWRSDTECDYCGELGPHECIHWCFMCGEPADPPEEIEGHEYCEQCVADMDAMKQREREEAAYWDYWDYKIDEWKERYRDA